MRRGCAALLVVLAACGRAGGGSAGVAERDSAGVRIVEVRVAPAELDRRWRMEAVPELTTDSVDGGRGIELFRVSGLHRLSDGRLLIANGGTSELLLVDPRSGAVRRYGRKGRGPGEFGTIGGLWASRGDTAYVYDLEQGRVTPFTPEAGFGSPVSLRLMGPYGFIVLRGRFADGTYLGHAARGYGVHAIPGVQTDSGTVLRVHPREPARVLARLPNARSWVSRQPGGATLVQAVPFDAGGVATAWAGGYYLGESSRYELRRYDPSGRLQGVIRRSVNPVAVTPADVEREAAERIQDGMDAASVRRILAEMPIPRHFPAFRRVVASADGGLWVQDQAGGDPSAPAAWTAFAPNGMVAGRLTLPPGVRPVEVAGDRLAAVLTDEDEIEHVLLYRLQPARR